MTPAEAEARALVARHRAFARTCRDQRRRWFISVSCKGAWDPTLRPWRGAPGGYRRYVWPLLFPSHDAAWAFAERVGVFKHIDRIPGQRGRIVSYTIEATRIGGRAAI